MQAPISVQLYSVRDQLDADFDGTIRKIADAGYVGVEPARKYGKSVQDARRLFDSLGLQVSSAHIPLPADSEKNQVRDDMAVLGSKNFIVPWIASEEFQTHDQIKAVCERLNQGYAWARENGLNFYYHNHWWEFRPTEALGGKSPFAIMIEELDDGVQFELDAYWAAVGGTDPIVVLKQYGTRIPLLHVKDGPLTLNDPMTAVGDGKLDYKAIIGAAPATSEWMVVEIDRCATDMLEAVRKSCAYLTQSGLARGRKS